MSTYVWQRVFVAWVFSGIFDEAFWSRGKTWKERSTLEQVIKRKYSFQMEYGISYITSLPP